MQSYMKIWLITGNFVHRYNNQVHSLEPILSTLVDAKEVELRWVLIYSKKSIQ